MVIHVRVSGDDISVPVPFVFVFCEFFCRIRAAHRIDDDAPALQPLHAVFDRPRAFDSAGDGQAHFAVVVDALRLGRIGRDGVIVIAVLDDPARRLFVRFLVDVVLGEDVHRFPVTVVVAADEAVRIGIPAPVLSLEDAVKMRNLFICDLPQFQIVKYTAAVAIGYAFVFMFIRRWVDFLQVLRVGDKLRAQPFRRRFRVTGMVKNAPRIRDKPFLVDPTGLGFRRVIGRKVVRIRAATQHGLVDRTFFFRPAKLVFFFLPQDADVAERRLNGFQLQRVVTAAKINRLAGFFQHDFQRRQLAVELIV